MSRSIERFKSEAVKFAKVISEKSADEIEKLVSSPKVTISTH